MANNEANTPQLAMIGDRDSVLIAKAAGLAVYDETNPQQASRLIHRLAREGVRVIFITESLFGQCGEAVEKYRSESFPAIIPIPDSKGGTGAAMAMIKANVEKAIGADILFNND